MCRRRCGVWVCAREWVEHDSVNKAWTTIDPSSSTWSVCSWSIVEFSIARSLSRAYVLPLLFLWSAARLNQKTQHTWEREKRRRAYMSRECDVTYLSSCIIIVMKRGDWACFPCAGRVKYGTSGDKRTNLVFTRCLSPDVFAVRTVGQDFCTFFAYPRIYFKDTLFFSAVNKILYFNGFFRSLNFFGILPRPLIFFIRLKKQTNLIKILNPPDQSRSLFH